MQVDPGALSIEQAGCVTCRVWCLRAHPAAKVCVDGLGIAEGGEVDGRLEVLASAMADLVAEVCDFGDIEEEAVKDTEERAGCGLDELREVEVFREEERTAVEGGDGIGDVLVDEEFDEEVLEVLVGGFLAGHEMSSCIQVGPILAVSFAGSDGAKAEDEGLSNGRVADQVLIRVARVFCKFVVLQKIADGAAVVVVFSLVNGGIRVGRREVCTGKAKQ